MGSYRVLKCYGDLDQRRFTTGAAARLLGGSEIVCGRAPRGFRFVGEIRGPFGGRSRASKFACAKRGGCHAPARSDRYMPLLPHVRSAVMRIGASGACPYPVAAWAHPTSANMTNSAASGLCRFICFDLFPPNTSAYSARAISSIRLRSLLRTFPTRAHRPACHLGRRVGCERGLEAGRVRRLLSESCGPPFELQDRRHAVVDLGAQLVRRCRDDRKAAHPFIGRDRISPEAGRDYHALSASAIAISDLPAPRIVRGAMTNCTASASTSTRSPSMQTRRANCAPTSTPHMPR